jgi:DNA primase large subunit
MLNKIDNISPGSEYSKASRPSGSSGSLASAYVRQSYVHDSVNISPALQFLNQVRWRLKEFKHVAKEKLFLDFILSDIEFQTTIDLDSIERADYLSYHITKQGNETNLNSKIISDLSVKIENIHYDEGALLLNLSALNVFYQRIFKQRIYRELTQNDKYVIDELVNGISAGMQDEFEHLNNQLFIFLDKLEGIRVDKKGRKDFNQTEIVTVKSIRLINGQ